MNFDLTESIAVLERTPAVLRALLVGLSEEWTHSNEGQDTWSAFDVVGHLIDGEDGLEHGPSGHPTDHRSSGVAPTVACIKG